jgi:hypothetical protein
MKYHYDNLYDTLNLITLHKKSHNINVLFLLNVFSGAKHVSPVLDIGGFRIPTRNIRGFNMFAYSSNHCPSSRRVSISNSVSKFTDVLGTFV